VRRGGGGSKEQKKQDAFSRSWIRRHQQSLQCKITYSTTRHSDSRLPLTIVASALTIALDGGDWNPEGAVCGLFSGLPVGCFKTLVPGFCGAAAGRVGGPSASFMVTKMKRRGAAEPRSASYGVRLRGRRRCTRVRREDMLLRDFF
jgi:hypothetical protein